MIRINLKPGAAMSVASSIGGLSSCLARSTLVRAQLYALRRTCHASELRATPSEISWIPSNTPSSQIAVVVRLANNAAG